MHFGAPLRVLPKRSAECAEFLCLDQPGQTAVSPQSVRWRYWRAGSTGSDVLLRRLSGSAADDRTNGDLHGTDAAPAPGRIHRSHRRACAGHLRSGHNGQLGRAATRSPFPGNTIPVERIDPVARTLLERYPLPTSAGTANNYRRVEQRNGRSGSVQPPHRSRLVDERRSRIRALDAISGRVHPGDATTRGQWGHRRNTRPTGHDVLVIRVQLPANVLEQRAERASHRRYADARSAGRPRNWTARASTNLGLPGIPSSARFPNTRADVSHRRVSAARVAAEHGVGVRHERHARWRIHSRG